MKKLPTNYLIVLVEIFVLILLTFIISGFNLDIKLQKLFYQPNSSSAWYLKNHPLWQFGYHYGTLPAILLTLAALIGLILSWIKSKIRKYRRYFLLIILTLIIGPGLFVNAILKDYWGRPRPRQVLEFGGKWEYKEVWQPGTAGKGKSFPCGHCSMGFFFITVYYCLKRKHQTLAYSFGVFSIVLGLFIGFARMSQGGHFLSDVIWAWGLTYLTATIFYYLVLKIPDSAIKSEPAEPIITPIKSSQKKRVLVTIAILVSFALMIFTFLFSKPFYQESSHDITGDEPFQIIKLHLDINRGDIFVHRGKFSNPVQIKTIAQGFGFPEYKCESNLTKKLSNDTLTAQYKFSIKGWFNEIDVQTLVYMDSSYVIYLEKDMQNPSIISIKD